MSSNRGGPWAWAFDLVTGPPARRHVARLVARLTRSRPALTAPLPDRPARKRECDAAVDVLAQHDGRAGRVTGQRTVALGAMLADGDLAAEAEPDHLVAKMTVEGGRTRGHQLARAAGRDQRLMEFPVVALPVSGIGPLAREQPALDRFELVMRGDDPALPFNVADRKAAFAGRLPCCGRVARNCRPSVGPLGNAR